MKRPPRCVVIGIDGATFGLLQPWIDSNHLPAIQRMQKGGSWATLQSVAPPVTPAAWASFLTSVNPGKHGVYDFADFDPRSGNHWIADARALRRPSLFDRLAEAGQEMVLLNVPLTYPPKAWPGICWADFMVPNGRRDFVHPSSVLDEFEKRFGTYEPHMSEINVGASQVSDILSRLERALDVQAAICRFLLDSRDCDFLMFYIYGTDRLQHILWHLLDPGHSRHDARESEKYLPRILNYYQRIDRQIADLMARFPESGFVVVSDHGFGPLEGFFNVNTWLLEKGYLRTKRSLAARLRRAMFRWGVTPASVYRISEALGLTRFTVLGSARRLRLLQALGRVFLSLQDVDFSETAAYGKRSYGQIFFNRVDPMLAEELRRELAAVRHPNGQGPFFGRLDPKEKIYSGPFLDRAPDIALEPVDPSFKCLGAMDFPSSRVFELPFGESGHHRPEGICLFYGPVFEPQGFLGTRSIMDVTPTVLRAYGLSGWDDMDGRVLQELFPKAESPALRSNAVAPPAETPETRVAADRDILQRLKDLGYL